MKKMLALFLAAALSLAVLSGCGGGSTPAPSESAAPESQEPAGATASQAPSADTSGLDLGGYTPEDPLVLKAAIFGYDSGDPMGNMIREFESQVVEATGGAVQFEVYTRGAMGMDKDIFEGVIMGTLDCGVNSTAIMSSYVDDLHVLDLNYLFDSYEMGCRFLKSDVFEEIKDTVARESGGAMVLGMSYQGFRSVLSNTRKVETPADMAGMKLRVIESTPYVEAFKAYGAVPQAMSASEAVTGLQQGTIDGQEAAPQIAYFDGCTEYTKYACLTEHVLQLVGITFSQRTFDSLTPDLQQIILECADNACYTLAENFKIDVEDWARSEMEAMGTEFVEVDKDAFKALAEPVNEKWLSEHELGAAWYEAIRALA